MEWHKDISELIQFIMSASKADASLGILSDLLNSIQAFGHMADEVSDSLHNGHLLSCSDKS